MASAFDETVFDFDNFLRQTTDNTMVHSKHDRHRKAILIAKKKTIATDSLIRKYYAKRELLDETEKTLVASKEECKQICIDYKLALERCSKLETDAQVLQNLKQELEAKSILAEDRCEAFQSHCNQLQELLKQHETQIETLKTENEQGQTNIINFENNIASLENEKSVLREHISIIIDLAGKKKNNHKDKSLLEKYKKMYSNTCKQTLSDDDSSADETVSFDNPSPLPTKQFLEPNNDEGNIPLTIHGQENKHESILTTTDYCNLKGKPALRKCDTDRDSDCHEVASVDTGRGSSLAFSGSDNCFNSPDYYLNDSPLATELFSNKEKRKQNDIATSPLRVIETIDKCTSPIIFDQYNFSNKLEHIKLKKVDSSNTSIIPNILIEKDVSPIKFNMNVDVSRSPLRKTSTTTNPVKSYNVIQTTDAQEKECLESNNSKKLSEDISDCEIEAILCSMRLSHELITPIPSTPVKTHSSTASRCVNDTSILHNDHSKSLCQEFSRILEDNKLLHTSFADLANKVTRYQEFAKEREDIKVLHTGIADLRREFNGIKSLLKMRLLNLEEINSGVNDEYFAENYVADMTNGLVANDSVKNRLDHVQIEMAPQPTLNPNKQLLAYQENNIESVVMVNSPVRNNLEHVQNEELELVPSQTNDSFANQKNDIDRLIMENSPITNTLEHLQFKDLELTPTSSEILANQEIDIESVDMENGPVKNTMDHVQLTDFELPSNQSEELLANQDKERESATTGLSRDHLLNTSRNLQFEEEPETNKQLEHNEDEIHSPDSPCNNSYIIKKKAKSARLKHKKITKLDKLRLKMQPKSKIQRVKSPPLKMLRVVLHPLTPFKKKIAATDSSASLNDKVAYEKAMRVMAELNAKRKVDTMVNSSLVNEPKKNTCLEIKRVPAPMRELVKDYVCQNMTTSPSSLNSTVTTRSRSRHVVRCNSDSMIQKTHSEVKDVNKTVDSAKLKEKELNLTKCNEKGNTQRRKRTLAEEPEIQSKRMLRSSTVTQSTVSENNINGGNCVNVTNKNDTLMTTINQRNMKVVQISSQNLSSPSIIKHVDDDQLVDYNDVDLFTDDLTRSDKPKCQNENISTGIQKPQESVLCVMIERYGVSRVKNTPSNISDSATNSISKKIEGVMTEVAELAPNEAKYAMNKFVEEIRKMNRRHFITGLMKYLKNPERKHELFSKMNNPPAPPMTKSEQILIYIITQMKCFWPDIVDCILNSIEYTLFQLNRTPDFGVIESMSHFYAILCRYSKAKNRLRLFILDAMYCIQFKSVPLIKQCLEVWMHILPLSHMGIAKSPLVTCMVYLLHFFKCDDKFNRVLEIRNILRKKYFYEITEWNENKIMELLKNSLKDLREIEVEKKMLRLALIIFAKRLGPRWCQDNIFKKILLPMISDEKVPERIHQFCVSMVGPLLKPYPPEMKVHCEIVMNQLKKMLTCNPSQPMQEAIFTSFIYMSKHNQNGVLQALLSWKSKEVSSNMESLLRDYVREKTMKTWKIVLSKVPLVR